MIIMINIIESNAQTHLQTYQLSNNKIYLICNAVG